MTNRKWLHTQTNEYDLLLALQTEMTCYNHRCVIEAVEGGSYVHDCPRNEYEWSHHDISKCGACISAWLNSERK